MNITCPLCHQPHTNHYHQDKKRDYWQCQTCDLVFVDKSQQLNHDDEKAVYQQHENNPQDQGYRHFLNRMAQPILDRVQPASHGLDFGCGPGPSGPSRVGGRGRCGRGRCGRSGPRPSGILACASPTRPASAGHRFSGRNRSP